MSLIDLAGRAYGRFTRTKFMENKGKWFAGKDKNGKATLENAIAVSAIASMVIKDGVGCAMYVYQSLHNDRIPEDKRKFVAALDLTNGGLMILAQIAMFFAMKKVNKSLFPKLFDKVFGSMSRNAQKRCSAAARLAAKPEEVNAINKYNNNNVATNIELKKKFEKLKDDSSNLFEFVTNLAAATIIGKRVIVPLIATPLADVVKKKWEKGNDNNVKDAKKVEANLQQKNEQQEVRKLDIKTTDNPNIIKNFKLTSVAEKQKEEEKIS